MQRHTVFIALAALAAIVLTTACTQSARESFAFESQAAPTDTVRVENVFGGVTLRLDPSATRVHGFVDVQASGFNDKGAARDAARRVTVVESGSAGDLALAVRLPPDVSPARFEVSLDLRVPGGTRVAAVAEAGPLYVEGLRVNTLDNRAGLIELRDTRGDARIRTLDGAVIADRHDGPLDIRTTNAAVDLFDVNGSVSARTTNGALLVDARPPRGGEIVLTTSDGPIELGLPYTFGAHMVASTTPDAPIDILGLDFLIDYDEPGHVEGFLGDGRGTVDLRTTFGAISVFDRR